MFKDAIRAALLDPRIYRDMDNESRSIAKALGIVALVALAFGIGIRNETFTGFQDLEGGYSFLGEQNLVMVVGFATVIVGWFLWTTIAFLIGSRALGGKASYRMLLRGIGIASGPGVLTILFIVPEVGAALFALSRLWMFVATAFAIRELQQSGWASAVISAFIGWVFAVLYLPSFLLQPV